MTEYSGAFVAFDVAKTKHAVAVAEAGRAGEVRFLGEVENTPARIERTIRKLAGRYGRLQVCFEAGPTGYPKSGGWALARLSDVVDIVRHGEARHSFARSPAG
jgi:hypothetical protein